MCVCVCGEKGVAQWGEFKYLFGEPRREDRGVARATMLNIDGIFISTPAQQNRFSPGESEHESDQLTQ